MHRGCTRKLVQQYQHCPMDSSWSGTREGTTKHAECVLTMGSARKRKLGKDVLKHVIDGAPDDLDGAMFDEVAYVVIFNIDMLGL